MTRYHYSKKPGGRGGGQFRRPHLLYGEPTDQATTRLGGRMNYSADALQSKLDKWQAGANELEAEMAEARTKRHPFEPMGTWDTCERCGVSKAEGPH